jgi:hypothetical protein
MYAEENARLAPKGREEPTIPMSEVVGKVCWPTSYVVP